MAIGDKLRVGIRGLVGRIRGFFGKKAAPVAASPPPAQIKAFGRTFPAAKRVSAGGKAG